SDEAKRVVESNQVIRRADDHVMIDAISQSSPTEAVVRASISGEMTNLKFRRYDTGWSWEFVETKAGGWIAPDQAIIELREPARLKRVAEWVATFVLELEGKRAGKLGIPLTVLALSIARNSPAVTHPKFSCPTSSLRPRRPFNRHEKARRGRTP